MRTYLLMASLMALGCSGDDRFEFNDDVDATFDFGLSHEDSLHTPYVAGSTVGVTVIAHRNQDVRGWSLQSDDSSVFEIMDEDPATAADPDRIQIHAVARTEGSTTLRLVDAGGTVRSEEVIEVGFPTRVQLTAAGWEDVDMRDAAPIIEDPNVLEGGTATFLVQYFDGSIQLFGNDVLSAEAAGLEVSVDSSYLGEDREWLRLSPGSVGEHELTLSVDGQALETITVFAVSNDAIADIHLHQEDDGDAEPDASLVVMSHALNAVGESVHGVDMAWTLGGEVVEGTGDLFRYTYDPDQQRTLVAERGDAAMETVIHGVEGSPATSNAVGCNAAGRVGAGAFLLLPILLIRRRRP